MKVSILDDDGDTIRTLGCFVTDGVFRPGSYLPLDPGTVAGVTDLRRG